MTRGFITEAEAARLATQADRVGRLLPRDGSEGKNTDLPRQDAANRPAQKGKGAPRGAKQKTAALPPRPRSDSGIASAPAREQDIQLDSSTVAGVVIWIPLLPPSVNHMYRNNGRGGRVLTDEAQAWRRLVAAEVAALGSPRLAGGPLELTLRLTYGTRRRTDIDNRIKAALDALALALDFDDARVARIEVLHAGYATGRPACEMVIGVLHAA